MRASPLFVLSLLCLSPLGFAQTTAPSAAATMAAAGDARGHWEGSIEMPGGTKLGVVVELSQDTGEWKGNIDIPMQGAHGLPLEKISVDGVKVAFAIKGVPGAPTFDGTLAGAKIQGTFTQGGYKLEF